VALPREPFSTDYADHLGSGHIIDGLNPFFKLLAGGEPEISSLPITSQLITKIDITDSILTTEAFEVLAPEVFEL